MNSFTSFNSIFFRFFFTFIFINFISVSYKVFAQQPEAPVSPPNLHLVPYVHYHSIVVPDSIKQETEEWEPAVTPTPADSAAYKYHIENYPFPGNFDSQTSTQTTNCPNSDFSTGTFVNWSGCWGSWNSSYTPPCNNPNQPWHDTPNGGYYYMNAAPGTPDPHVPLPSTVFPGEPYSVRLGKTPSGGDINTLVYSIAVDTNNGNLSNNFFVYRYAVVLYNIYSGTGHDEPDERPRFTIEIKDYSNTYLLNPDCGFYDVFPDPLLTGWNSTGNYVWKDWNTIGLDLSEWHGETVNVVFTTHGCSPGGHAGYAYISAFCQPKRVMMSGCSGSGTAVLNAPPGFATYQWTGPYCSTCSPTVVGTGQTITIVNAVEGHKYKLMMTAIPGTGSSTVICKSETWATLTYTVYTSVDFTSNVNCSGNQSSFLDISTLNQNEVVSHQWDFGDGTVTTTTTNPVFHTYAAPGNYTVTLNPISTDGCTATVTQQINVDLPPTVTNTQLEKMICSENQVNIPIEFNSPTGFPVSGAWTKTCVSGTVTITNNPTSQTGTIINDLIVNTGTATATVRYTITPQVGACNGPPATYTVTVVPVSHLTNSPTTKAICSGSTTNINLLSDVTGSTFTWTTTVASGSVTITNSTAPPGTLINDRIINNGFTNAQVVYTITPLLGVCAGPSKTYTVTVYPVPDLSNDTPPPVCSGSSFNTTLSSHMANTSFAWTAGADPPGSVAGFTASTTTNVTNINELLTLTPAFSSVSSTVNYYITPWANQCPGNVSTLTVTVNPVPTADGIPNKTLCNGELTNPILFTGGVAGTVFNWTNSNTAIGLNDSGWGDIPSFNATNPTTVPQVATITVTPTYTNGGTTCTGAPITFTITVNPTAQVNPVTSQVICNGSGSAQVTFSTQNTGGTTTYAWTNDNTAIGLAASGNGDINPFTAINTGLSLVTATITVTPTFTNNGTSCQGPSQSFTITVNPTAQVDPVAGQVVCNGSGSAPVIFTTQNTGGTTTYSWTNDNTPIGLAASGNGDILAFTASNPGLAPVVATIVVTPHFYNGSTTCDGSTKTFTITVNPLGQVVQPDNQT
ncbi:MAG: PKD domain-containing protein, partial [Alphaproteobacteria bacterium]|nr:PKD domain-containing protein [Alphaproteobacteria bacterium]